ncbi:MAG: ATP-grasp domain-containing protein [bacterium]|nr:ATP-grasp domain-containing protein [bacterium]
MFTRLLVANRGEIACRVMKTARRLGLHSIAVYTAPDREARHVGEADEAWSIGEKDGYLDINRLIAVARDSGAEALHPGYGFLSENPALAEACEDSGIDFIGPPARASRIMGLKDSARAVMVAAGVPVSEGHAEESPDDAVLLDHALDIGFPVIIKAVAGGGGRGLRRVETREDFPEALRSARREARAAFGDERMLIERFVASSRHVEVQVLADSLGTVLHFPGRDCSVQRRWQKLIEESPAPGLPARMREAMGEAAVAAARAVDYLGAGTVEFIVGKESFSFLEMNTRLQVEHPVSEMITGIDLVEWQLRIAAGEALTWCQDTIRAQGHAIEARLCAEDPSRDFMPSTGRIHHQRMPRESPRLRIDSGIRDGVTVSGHYDSLLAKVIAHGDDRDEAVSRLSEALGSLSILGVATNAGFLKCVLDNPEFREGAVDTGFLERVRDEPLAAPGVVIAAAAMHFGGILDRDSAGDPWACLAGWRLWGDDSGLMELAIDGKPHDVAVTILDRDRCRIGDDVFRVVERTGASLVLDIGSRVLHLDFVVMGEDVHVAWRGSSHVVRQRHSRIAAGDSTAASGDVTAPLPGTVAAVRIAEGDTFSRGDVLVVLEAMKVEIAIRAEGAGTARTVAVQPGDRVEEGTTLVTVAAPSSDPAPAGR